MPYITICKNRDCRIKTKCYRYTAKPNKHFQTYRMFIPKNFLWHTKCVFQIKQKSLNSEYFICNDRSKQ